jgi:phage terminase Nu1 subunit (DNA packaging protein)
LVANQEGGCVVTDAAAAGRDPTQDELACLFGVSQQAVSMLFKRDILRSGWDVGTCILSYVTHLRAVAEERDANSPLYAERARLAAEQADRIAMQNAATRRALASRAILEAAFTIVRDTVVELIASLPGRLSRRHDDLPAEATRYIDWEIRAICAAARAARFDEAEMLSVDDAADFGVTERDGGRAEP